MLPLILSFHHSFWVNLGVWWIHNFNSKLSYVLINGPNSRALITWECNHGSSSSLDSDNSHWTAARLFSLASNGARPSSPLPSSPNSSHNDPFGISEASITSLSKFAGLNISNISSETIFQDENKIAQTSESVRDQADDLFNVRICSSKRTLQIIPVTLLPASSAFSRSISSTTTKLPEI